MNKSFSRVLFESNKYTGEILSEFNKPEIIKILNNISDYSNKSEIIYKVRNQIFKLPVIVNNEKIILCVKQFPKFSFFRSILYKKTGSKAKKSFEAASFLKENSVGVPNPVAYIEKWEGNILQESYYIDVFEENISSFKREMINILRNEKDCEKFLNLLEPVAVEFSKMHKAGFIHNDSGYQNIMIRRKGDKEWKDVKFIDLNRGKIKKQLSLKEKAYDIAKLEIPSDFLRIFLYIYFENNPIPKKFAKYEKKYRFKITFHNESRKYRHPFKYLKSKNIIEEDLNIRPHYKNMWLWDNKSGQPAVMLSSKHRKKYRSKIDLFKILWSNVKYGLKIYQNYKKLKSDIYKQSVDIRNKIGITIEIDEKIEERLKLLYEIPIKCVFIRIYSHKDKKNWEKCCEIIKILYEKNYEVSIGLIQSRDSVIYPQTFIKFSGFILQRVFAYIKFCEVLHAVNRVKWGIWNLNEYKKLILPFKELFERYNEVKFLFPAVNDFEFHFSVKCLDIIKKNFDVSANSCHLYVDRRGAPENFQGKFSLIEKCILGKAIGESVLNKETKFYITEINWPLKGKEIYSPIGCPFIAPGITENPIHVDEEQYSQFMIRTYLIAICSGMTERLWWWRLCAKGYGLVDDINGFKPYKSYYALKYFLETLKDNLFRYYVNEKNMIFYYFDNFVMFYTMEKIHYEILEKHKINLFYDIYGKKISNKNNLQINTLYYVKLESERGDAVSIN
ncbi:MAG: hypothetical protein M0R46_01885 [Candidatus Muirbacterium halophilum]|nr:hypothetical protein [Candidatus Muirbacterium halophilum]MCK9474646.1 hypothetical protein [Candidatus Muirbacterium halophilum]